MREQLNWRMNFLLSFAFMSLDFALTIYTITDTDNVISHNIQFNQMQIVTAIDTPTATQRLNYCVILINPNSII